ncbi:uncharacterized protein TRIADDRAFT_54530 [Trichoplax adhaerens]|uniref:Cilia- and flagella-associated protein 161 n=1 Tax=Trichoplax adhaerens TaxID=10228 RepID=B3RSA7_TRIAD|nr:hypothetical protein TRIADDRAFT_54530 [Trichoplax adhaerens]EDV27021.1 hypothetical protein TRIADDRAFT_54530 [Trichoplax adhaerens]|eukprot:XP_002111017.1 hypothetical protein TRIADDRAFT_54530 [Trichoplax adhaerens]
MSYRTYNPAVRIGNWQEDVCLEEEKLKDFLEKKERGELLTDRAYNLRHHILQKIDLSSPADDGYIHFGDIVCLYNVGTSSIASANMSDIQMHNAQQLEGPCPLTSSKNFEPCIRNAFQIVSADNVDRTGEILHFEQHFCLSTLSGIGGQLKLYSDRATFIKYAKYSRLQDATLSAESNYQCEWKLLVLEPKQRLIMEGMPVPIGQKLLINHCKSNQCLASLPEYTHRTSFGREFEVVAHTHYDPHKIARDINHWNFIYAGQSCN